MHLSRSDLSDAMHRIYIRKNLSTSYSVYSSELLASIETVAHEVAHWVALGERGLAKDLDEAIEARIAEMSDGRANSQEAMTCAIEILGLRRFGMCVDIRRLADNAASMMRGDVTGDMSASRKLVRAAMKTRRAKTGARRFERIVLRFLK